MFSKYYLPVILITFLHQGLQACDTIPNQKPELVLSELIKFRSFSGMERSTGEYLMNKSAEMGFSTHIFSQSDSSYNFSASLYPLETQKPSILFLSHIDIVPANDSSSWRYSPFSGALVNDTVWGRGCIDMKGIGLMQLDAAKGFLDRSKKTELPYNVIVLFVSGEESGGQNGAKIITENYLNILHPMMVIGEGGGGLKNILPSKPEKLVFFISVAEKKSLWLKLTVHKRTHGHSSIPSKKTANTVLMKSLKRLKEKKPIIIFDKTSKRMFHDLGKFNGGFKGFILKNISKWVLLPFRKKILENNPELFNEVTNSIQLTSISNPQGPPNVIAGEASAFVDCRLLPGITSEKFISKLKYRLHNPKVDIKIVDQSPDEKTTDIDSRFDAIANGLKKSYPDCEVLPVIFPATTDNSYFRSKEVPSFGILPIELSQQLIESVHGINECLPVSTFYKGIDAYKMIMEELLKGK